MFDKPPATLLIAEARRALDAGVAAGFPQKVVANALGIAQRELEMGPGLVEAEHKRLVALIARDDTLPALNAALASIIRSGEIALDDVALLEHLIRTSVAKLEVDQPGYPAFRAWREGA
jgi:hypothetical protein